MADMAGRTGEQKILVTEVTRMKGGMVCVAGLDLNSRKMVRPLQVGGQNWEEDVWVESGYMVVGNRLTLKPAPPGDSAPPHATEDLRVATVDKLESATPEELYTACLETADPSIEAIFNGELVENRYVLENADCRSLGCIMVQASALRFRAPFDNKVEAAYRDDRGVWHNLPVTALEVKKLTTSAAGAAALEDRLARIDGLVALRIGLARAFEGKEKN
jgi:hypothetical protein